MTSAVECAALVMDGYFLSRGEAVPVEPSWFLIASMLEVGVYE